MQPDFIRIYSVDEDSHLLYKDSLLRHIKLHVKNSDAKAAHDNFYYDYNELSKKRTYEKEITYLVKPYIDSYAKEYGCIGKFESNWWFQQYFNKGEHKWHDHGSAAAVIYYAELPEGEGQTVFYPFGKFDVKEGDIMIFPGFLPHKSPPILSNKRKTIFAANISLSADEDFLRSEQNPIK